MNDLFSQKALRLSQFFKQNFPILNNYKAFTLATNESINTIYVYTIDNAIQWSSIPQLPQTFEGTKLVYDSMSEAVAY